MLNKMINPLIHLSVCWMLLFWQVVPAQGQGLPSLDQKVVQSRPQGNQTVTQTTPTVTDDTASETTNGNVIKIEGEDVDPKSKLIFSNILLFAAGLTAPLLVMKCKTISSYIFAGAALVYLANEVGLFTGFTTATNKEMAAYIGRGDEDKQIDSLVTAANQTEKAKKAAKRRAFIAKIAAAGFGAASAAAMMEQADWFGSATCAATGSINIKQTNGILALQKSKFKDNFEHFHHSEIVNIKVLQENILISRTGTEAFFTYKDSIRFIEGDIQSSSIEEFEKEKGNELTNSFFGNNKNLLVASLDLLTSKAFAQGNDSSPEKEKKGFLDWSSSKTKGVSAALGLGAGALAATKSVGDTIMNSGIMKSPWTRAAGFAGFAAFAYGGSKESEEASQKLAKRESEYRRLASELRSKISQNTKVNPSDGEQFIGPDTQTIGNNTIGIDNNSTCFTGGAGSLNLDANCDCVKNGSCKKPEIPDLTALPSFTGQTLMTDSLGSLSSAGKDVFAGRLKGAETSGQALTSNAARITKLRDGLAKKLSDQNVKNGGGPFDLEKQSEKFQDFALKKVNDAFNQLTPAEQGKLASFGSGFGGLVDGDKKDEKEKVEESSVAGTGRKAVGDVNPNSGAPSNKTAEGATWDFNFDEAEAAAEQAAIEEALMAEEDQNYVVDGDISEDRNKNLFNIITRRYLKSAYPVLFDEK